MIALYPNAYRTNPKPLKSKALRGARICPSARIRQCFRPANEPRCGFSADSILTDFPRKIKKEREPMYLFDLDGTLIDSNGIWADVDRVFLSRRGFPYTKEYRDGIAHMIFPLAAEFTKRFCGLSESCEEIMAEWMALAQDSYSRVALKPFARELLEKLRADGERLAVFTSAVPEHCRTALAVHGLAPFFEQVVYAHDLGMNKSTPEAFRRAAALLGAAPEDCVLLDDSVRSCRAAKEAGLTVIGVYDPVFADMETDMPEAFHRYIHSLRELLI